MPKIGYGFVVHDEAQLLYLYRGLKSGSIPRRMGQAEVRELVVLLSRAVKSIESNVFILEMVQPHLGIEIYFTEIYEVQGIPAQPYVDCLPHDYEQVPQRMGFEGEAHKHLDVIKALVFQGCDVQPALRWFYHP